MDDLTQCRVLLVDDVKDNIKILVEALKDSYQLGFALNGENALEYARTKSPDLILLDIMMPEMDGYEVCRRLKADPETAAIPVLFVTAVNEAENKAAGFEAGAVDYITKPFEILEIKARVKTHLSLKLARQALENQRDQMQQSLDLAMEVQQSLLPIGNPRIDGLDIAGKSIYCDETGGDYYDYLLPDPPDQGRIGVVVGDVSEHGIPSALLMTTARAFLRQRSSMPGDIGMIITDVNRQLTRDVKESGQFMTLFYCEIDVEDKIIRWASAGHDPALVYDHKTDAFDELLGAGPALGLVGGFKYIESDRPVKRGQIIVIGTDGIWEARNPEGRMFGKRSLRNVIREYQDQSAARIVDAVIEAVNDFQNPLKNSDDVTLVVIKVED